MIDILIVDDAAGVRERLVEILGAIPGLGKLAAAESIADATHRLGTGRFDLVILDIRLPDGSGIDLLKALRREGGAQMIVMLTSFPLAPYRDACLAAGADEFLDKATACDRLLDIVLGLAAARGVA